MPRIGFKNNRIKAIIYHTDANKELDEPIIYNLDDGRHICVMPRAPRTNYRKKEKPNSRHYRTKKSIKKEIQLNQTVNPDILDSRNSSNDGNTGSVPDDSLDSKTFEEELKKKADFSVLKTKQFYSKFFEFVAEQFNGDDYFNGSDFEEP